LSEKKQSLKTDRKASLWRGYLFCFAASANDL